MSLIAEALAVWLVLVPAAILLYATLGRRYFRWRLMQRRSAARDRGEQPIGAVISIAAAGELRARAPRGTQPRKAPLSA